jgi:ring-1,2-phenylacetyl-CoA epoxidase subunit PaaD
MNATPTLTIDASIDRARTVAATVKDPEMPMLTLGDLGVLRGIERDAGGTLVVSITPTYSGCPAMAAMRADLKHALTTAGFSDVDVRTVLTPAWSSDWITENGRRKLAEHGIAPPGTAQLRHEGPVALTLTVRPPVVQCPLCGSADTERTSEFGATACKSLHRCRACSEPFDRVKEI